MKWDGGFGEYFLLSFHSYSFNFAKTIWKQNKEWIVMIPFGDESLPITVFISFEDNIKVLAYRNTNSI